MNTRRNTPRGPGLTPSPYSKEPNLEAAVYVISVAAELTGLHPQTLRAYERMGLIQPGRTGGGGRRYSHRDIERLREIADLTSAGIGIEGVRRIMQLELQVDALRARNEELLGELEALRSGLAARAAVQPANKLPVLHQAVGQSVVVWRRGS